MSSEHCVRPCSPLKVCLKGPFHKLVNHANEGQQPKELDQRERFDWSAEQCCLVFPLNCVR